MHTVFTKPSSIGGYSFKENRVLLKLNPPPPPFLELKIIHPCLLAKTSYNISNSVPS